MRVSSSNFLIVFGLVLSSLLTACQTPTQVVEIDRSIEKRVFSKIEYGKEVTLKRAVIVDVRSRFDHEMSRVPRSFFAYWKDWDLRPYRGDKLDKKRQELQKLLALHGVEPLTQVVILGNGLSGQGEEFLLASTLLSLGVERISFMSAKQAKQAMVARHLPKIANAPLWEKPLQYDFSCDGTAKSALSELSAQERMAKADIVLMAKAKGPKALAIDTIFASDLKIKKRPWPKTIKPRVYSPGNLFAFGVALFLKDQGRQPCVL